jgi:transcriptional regulator with XRE-family HTH domain
MNTQQPVEEISTPSNVVKLPYSVTRRAYTRRPRRLKNGSPEERSILAAAAERARGHVLRLADEVVDEPPAAKLLLEVATDEARASPADRDGWLRGFAQRLRAARMALGISEDEAAAAAGISLRTWRRFEATGRGRRCTSAVGRFAMHYRVSLDDLFRDEEAPAPASAAPDPACVLSETGRNERLRRDRRAVWRRAQLKLTYWRACQKFHFAIYQNREVLDDLDCPAALRRKHGDFSEPWVLDNQLLVRIKDAEVDLILTPAPDVASLKWKQQAIKHIWYRTPNADSEYLRRHIGLKQSPFRDIEQAIAADAAFLAAHPARQCKANKQRRGSSGEQ